MTCIDRARTALFSCAFMCAAALPLQANTVGLQLGNDAFAFWPSSNQVLRLGNGVDPCATWPQGGAVPGSWIVTTGAPTIGAGTAGTASSDADRFRLRARVANDAHLAVLTETLRRIDRVQLTQFDTRANGQSGAFQAAFGALGAGYAGAGGLAGTASWGYGCDVQFEALDGFAGSGPIGAALAEAANGGGAIVFGVPLPAGTTAPVFRAPVTSVTVGGPAQPGSTGPGYSSPTPATLPVINVSTVSVPASGSPTGGSTPTGGTPPIPTLAVTTPTPAPALAPVPLPAAGWMLIAALGGLWAMRRRSA